jgi:hypothetical protein
VSENLFARQVVGLRGRSTAVADKGGVGTFRLAPVLGKEHAWLLAPSPSGRRPGGQRIEFGVNTSLNQFWAFPIVKSGLTWLPVGLTLVVSDG